jgi:DNA-binding CsgD family transcriptional regulator/PAS domain-containing protein
MNTLRQLQRNFERILDSQEFQESELDYSIVERHVSLLKHLDANITGAISVFDLLRREHVYSSPKFESIFGWDLSKAEKEGISYSYRRVHPDDLLLLSEAGTYFTSFVLSLTPKTRRDYKMFSDYRILGADNKYVRVLEQQSVLELDLRGNIWLAFSVLDLSPFNDTQTPFRCRLTNAIKGELFLFPPTEKDDKDILSAREKEILHMISKGLVSRQIADVLYISVNTVNTHRQRIIEKLDVSNTSEAIRYAMDLGILSGAE